MSHTIDFSQVPPGWFICLRSCQHGERAKWFCHLYDRSVYNPECRSHRYYAGTPELAFQMCLDALKLDPTGAAGRH